MFDLAHRLGSTPRRVLLAAACMTDQPDASHVERLIRLRRNGIRHSGPADECANLLLTPVASYARDALGKALNALWQDSGKAGDP